jgi:hypothetical protein
MNAHSIELSCIAHEVNAYAAIIKAFDKKNVHTVRICQLQDSLMHVYIIALHVARICVPQ